MEMIFCGNNLEKAAQYVEELQGYNGGVLAQEITILVGCGKPTIFDGDVRDCDVFVVLKNADFTEGRGPMVVNKVFKNAGDAVKYILQQEGVFGTKQRLRITTGRNIHGRVYAYSSFNGYEIKPMKMG